MYDLQDSKVLRLGIADTYSWLSITFGDFLTRDFGS